MKLTAVKLKTAVFIAFAAWSVCSFAQLKTVMYVMKNGTTVFKSPVSGIDNVTFDKAASGDALFLHKKDGSPVSKILLNDIQQFSFFGENLFTKTSNGSEAYLFSEIKKLLFGDITAGGINNPVTRNGIDVFVYADYHCH